MDFTDGATAKTWGVDQYGHGTHIAGIIAERGRDGYSGMAPGAWIVNLKALEADGSGKTSDVIDAIDWAIANRRRFNIRIINLSLGHPVFESYLDDPLCQAAQRAVGRGDPGGGGGGESRQDRRRPSDRGGRDRAGQHAVGADGGGAEHAGHGAAVRRRDGDLQLARARRRSTGC